MEYNTVVKTISSVPDGTTMTLAQLDFSEGYPTQLIEKGSRKGKKIRQKFKCQTVKPKNNCRHLKCNHKIYSDSSREIPTKEYSDKKEKSRKRNFNKKKLSKNRRFDRINKTANDEICDLNDDSDDKFNEYYWDDDYSPYPMHDDSESDSYDLYDLWICDPYPWNDY